ncbi:hypothetical protein FOA43_000052 [Brettanomyces nanus]|uniref:Autophagy-related protein 101 n=1 Tax=Eeniella nana TaxID=13502 RepID=A0A875RVB1_EENNA|nr:uncharacterized protein FOA43_000052 [Brettanomyces nanus]QPG72751.1 hypothetical protein FOA43_000052 [Brettanomyces nanus]
MEFNLKLVTDLDTAADYIKGIVWTIFFNRLFGFIVPQDGLNFLGVPYPTTDLPELDRLIESKIECIMGELNKGEKEYNDQLLYKCVIVVKFYEKAVMLDNNSNGLQDRQGSNNVSTSSASSSSILMPRRTKKYQNCWEKWILKVTILNNHNTKMLETDTNSRLDFFKEDFEKNMFKLFDYVDKNRSHIPPIQSVDKAPFPYKILFALNTHEPKSLESAFASFEMSSKSTLETGTNIGSGSASGSVSGSLASLEYVTTTEEGDLILTTTPLQHEQKDANTNPNYRPNIPSGEELLRNGYKFIKKFLE